MSGIAPSLRNGIRPVDISVVIAGYVKRKGLDGDLGLACIRSLRQNLPGAQLILSTWSHCDSSGLDPDILILNPEPASIYDCTGRVSNFHKQRISFAAGLACAQRKFVLKFRPDLILNDCTIIEAFDLDRKAPFPFLLTARVVLTNLFIPDPLRDPTFYHISDIVQFGLREDITRIWRNDVVDSVSLLGNRYPRRIIGNFSGYTDFRMLPEQALTIAWLTSDGIPVSIEHINDSSIRLMDEWLAILFSDFEIVDARQAGIRFPDRFFKTALIRHNIKGAQRENPLYVSRDLRHKVLRFLIFYSNKYLTCWFKRNYLRSVAHVVAYSLPSGLFKRIKRIYD